MKIGKIQQQELIHYIYQFDKYRKIISPEKIEATKILFQNKQYDLAISDLKKYFGISQKVSIIVKEKHSLSGNASARIMIPVDFFKTVHAFSHKYEIHITKKMLDSFENFVTVIAHELAHLLLFLEGNDKWSNERAVDTLTIIGGFGHEFRIGRNIVISGSSHSIGYLSDQEFQFVYQVFSENKKFAPKKIPWYKKIWRKVKTLWSNP